MNTTASIILLVVLGLFVVMYPLLIARRNKREQEKQANLINSLKKGEYVLTYSGIFGKIVDIFEKEIGKFIVIETGEKNKNYITVSENAIYSVVSNNPKVYTLDETEQSKKDNKPEVKKENNVSAEKANEKPAEEVTSQEEVAEETKTEENK